MILGVNGPQGAPGTQGSQPAPAQKATLHQVEAPAAVATPDTSRNVHILMTSNGSPYINWQSRMMYGSFLRVQKMPGGERMTGFTRILHRSKDDGLSGEMPTFRADPLHPQCDTWCQYPVADRPNAVRQYFDALHSGREQTTAEWLYLGETDYIWIKPLQAPPVTDPKEQGLAYMFSYIQPASASLAKAIRALYPESKGPVSDIPRTGPAPAMMRKSDWLRVCPDWERLTAQIEASEELKTALGWVREMYAFSVALALEKVQLRVDPAPVSPLIAQPPSDAVPGEASALHYTWASTFKDKDRKEVYSFDKRTWVAPDIVKPVKKPDLPPPFQEGWTIGDSRKLTKPIYDTVFQLLQGMRDAADEMNRRFPA
ncbi:hypothetical protein H632_c402p1 [Helicosporidium sp. ATCC 50920]|nr:hypothetical protein H632_c402p1 [Helicosporidium sp. ATCC 50920]|eukprot:KDD75998.1 hypothetical protein H632_c402p1 [Helicosporidium sp. ATCC 50920]